MEKKQSSIFQDNNHGYSLLETVIALVILIAVVVPLVSLMHRDNTIAAARNELTGIWLIEREAALVRDFPEKQVPLKRYTVKDREWTLRINKKGHDIVEYYLVAELKGKKMADACFFGRVEKEK
jgi:Tfp pilus assembly protein FimT